MKVVNHILHRDDGAAVPSRRSPNFSDGVEHRFLVVHYTAGRSLESAVNTLCNPKHKASAHLAIGRDGDVVQLVTFDKRAWHAGTSKWQHLKALNGYSIGIELDNPGRLKKKTSGWQTYFGTPVADEDVVIAAHKNGGPECGWHEYTEAQFQTLYECCEALIDAYPSISDVIGHDDIAPGRKSDPGPAFDMERLRSWLFGRQ